MTFNVLCDLVEGQPFFHFSATLGDVFVVAPLFALDFSS